MERWRNVFRNGFAPRISTRGLLALRQALICDDFRLQQGGTTVPAASVAREEYPCEGACALGFCGWQGGGGTSVGEVDAYFQRLCWEADDALGEPAACRHFLNWFDDTPRHEMRRDLLGEVELALALRHPPVERRTAPISAAPLLKTAAV
jgi:hypothetical protein